MSERSSSSLTAWPALRVVCLVAALGACARAAPPAASGAPKSVEQASAAPGEWLTSRGLPHELAGRAWDVKAGRFVELPEIAGRLDAARFVLFGEKHDNPDHHRLQARVLAELVRRGRKPAVAFEMLEVSQQPAVDAYLATAGATAARFGEALDWGASRWPPYVEYQPIFEVAFTEKLPIIAANLEQVAARGLVGHGRSVLGEERVKELALDRPFPSELEAPLVAELRASHCGQLPEKILEPMALAQHARDAQMARALVRGATAGGAVLITGAGHARLDRGVPYYLKLFAGETNVASLSFVEVADGENEPAAYLSRFGGDRLPFDFVWFTPRLNDDDPCAAFGAKGA